jgi:phage terminase large subunit
MPLPYPFDFKKPDYTAVFQWRLDRLYDIRKKPNTLKYLYTYYRDNPAQFIIDWGMTYDPRNTARDIPSYCPFILFPRQEEWIAWVEERFKNQENGLADKSRDGGFTWAAIAYACTKCLFNDGFNVGFGSRKQEYVDHLGDMKAILPKGRIFLSMLPPEFRRGWTIKDAPHMRISFPETQSSISGEAGDGIGRGDRASIYFVDESAWLPRPQLVEASLSETTNCRIDISTPHGMGNPFARKIFAGILPRFSMHWRDDPRKDQEWYDKKCKYIDDPVVIAQELDLDYSASVEGVIIPAIWVQAAIDSHVKLGIVPKGIRRLAFDPADEGKDKLALIGRYGIIIEYAEQWSGFGGDIYKSVEKVFDRCDLLDYTNVVYDTDGLGASIRGDARKINEKRRNDRLIQVRFIPYRGSGDVIDETKDPFERKGEAKDGEKSRTNEDYFGNRKAQEWWRLRRRFLNTYRAVVLGMEYDPDSIISIPSALPHRHQLVTELSQPVYYENDAGKMFVDKAPDGVASPNLADATVQAFAKIKRPQRLFGAKLDTENMDE